MFCGGVTISTNAVRKKQMNKKRLLTDRSGDLAERIQEEQAKILMQEMDREILWGMLESMGWSRVNLPWPVTAENLKEIHTWVNDNAKGAHEHSRTDFIFEQDDDAMWFKLRWLG